MFEELVRFSLARFLAKKKSFEREWKMAAIWQLSPKVSASMVFHARRGEKAEFFKLFIVQYATRARTSKCHTADF